MQWINLCCEGCAMQCRMFSDISDLYPVAKSNPHTVVTTKKYLQILPNAPYKQNFPSWQPLLWKNEVKILWTEEPDGLVRGVYWATTKTTIPATHQKKKKKKGWGGGCKKENETTTFWALWCFTWHLLELQGNTFTDNRDSKQQQTKVHHFSVIEEKLNPYNSLSRIENNWKVYL